VAIRLKTPDELERMRRAGRVVRLVLDRLGERIAPGVTTEELDREAGRICREHGAECLFNGVPGRGGAGPFPGNICASLNDEVVHGIPSTRRAVREGDVLSVDFGVRLDGWCGDAACTYAVGEVSDDARRLLRVTETALAMAIDTIRPHRKWSDVARVMQSYIEEEGFSVVQDFVGHGIGREMHEDPKIPNFVSRELLRGDIRLEEGMVLAIEPMVNMGSPAVRTAGDGWTVKTRDGLPSAHFEHTVAVVAGGADVLTDGR